MRVLHPAQSPLLTRLSDGTYTWLAMNHSRDKSIAGTRGDVIRRLVVSCAILLSILTLAFALDVSYGEVNVPLGSVWRVMQSHLPLVGGELAGADADYSVIVWDIRVPRAVLALTVGMMLAMAGAALQGLLLNPLADPYTVGVSSGAALGAGVATAFVTRVGLGGLAGEYTIAGVAFVTAICAMFVVYALARSAGRVSVHSFLLAGIVVGSFLWALLSFVLAWTAGDSSEAQKSIIFWLMGSFERGDQWMAVWVAAPFAGFGLVALFAFARDLNVFAMGEDTARHLGIETENLKLIIIVVASLITAAAVAVSGIIGFLGLVVPHICRRLFGPDHRVLIPTSALGGATLAVLADLASRSVLPPSGMPVGVVTAMLGAPFFLYLLKAR